MPRHPMEASRQLCAYLEQHADVLHVTGLTEGKKWPNSALSLGVSRGLGPEDAMRRCVHSLTQLVKAKKALFVISKV